MNKRYMDFVPAKKAVNVTPRRPSGRAVADDAIDIMARQVHGKGANSDDFVRTKNGRPISRKVATQKETRHIVHKAPEIEQEVLIEEDTTEILDARADTFSIKNEPVYGVIEDYRPKFVHAEVEKRPLSRSHADSNVNRGGFGAQKVQKQAMMPVENSVENFGVTSVNNSGKSMLKIPKSPFINHGKVAKRPLSKNVYEKKIEPTKEEPKGPLTIIDKPDTEQKSGLVATILLTIILGAVAGTIAFLLLPK